MYYKVEISGVDTSKLKTLRHEETNELLRRAHAGDKAARNLLVECNLKLVLSAVQRFSGRGGNPDDLFQVGCIGLIKAIERFDIELGLRLSTYAFSLIIGEMRRFLRDCGMVKVTRRVREQAIAALKKKEELQNTLNREPTVEEIAAAMGQPKEDVVLAMEAIMDPTSLYAPAYSDGRENVCIIDQVQDKTGVSDWLDEMLLRQAMEALSDREKKILSLRFFAGKTQMEVSRVVGISQAQVSRIEKGALQHIKTQL
mgnify:FL=1